MTMQTEATAPACYDGVMRAIHWTTLVLVTCTYIAIWIADPAIVGSYVRQVTHVHRSLGLTVAALTLFRLLWRWHARIPSMPADMPRAQKIAARTSEGLLYVLMIAQPAVGLLYSNAYGVRVNFFLLAELPSVIERNRTLGPQLGELHTFLGYSFLALIGVHSAAALFHHFVRRDDVLNAMLPARLRDLGRSAFAILGPKRQT